MLGDLGVALAGVARALEDRAYVADLLAGHAAHLLHLLEHLLVLLLQQRPAGSAQKDERDHGRDRSCYLHGAVPFRVR